jgi:hypothetical protein
VVEVCVQGAEGVAAQHSLQLAEGHEAGAIHVHDAEELVGFEVFFFGVFVLGGNEGVSE